MGAAVGSVAHSLFPAYTAGPGAYALVGMGTAFAGIVRTPLTSVIMIFEVTRDYTIIVPLMISNLIAYFISSRLQPQAIYEALAHQDGVHLPTAEIRARAGKGQVSQAMRPAPALAADADIGTAMSRLHDASLDAWPVSDDHGLLGMIGKPELEEALSNDPPATKVSDVLKETSGNHLSALELPHVHPDHSLSLALERMGSSGLHVLPVVSRADIRQLLGVVALDDILAAYGVGKGPL
jgi:CIC family chloride channel protein